MPQDKNIFGDLFTFALIEHSTGETPTFKSLEKKALWHILPETMYLAMKCEHRSLIGESTIISPVGAIFKERINFELERF